MSLGDNSLGRSLGEVFAKTMRREPSKGYLEVDLGLLRPPAANPRTEFDEVGLNELAASIRQHGILQPIVVLRRDVGFEILSGERRWRAAQIAGLAKVPVVVRDEEDPQHVAELRLVENIQRMDLNPVELAKAYQALIDTHGLTHDQVADRVNKERSSVTNALRLLDLPPPILAKLQAGVLSQGHAKALIGLDPAWQGALAERIALEGLSVREAERLAKAGPEQSVGERIAAAAARKPPHIKELEANLLQLFGTKVAVREKADGRGAITLHFDSREQFQRIVAIMDRFVKQTQREAPRPPGPTP
jgi:ParB family chromosome partitioning protein